MKRPHNAPRAAHKAHKRQKLESALGLASNKPKRKVRINDLSWKGVSMPDRLEDFEGFYGLEEIDDVEVVRDADTGVISFQTTKTEEEVEQEKEEIRKHEEEEAERLERIYLQQDKDQSGDESASDSGEDSWEGFSDAEDQAGSDTAPTGDDDDDDDVDSPLELEEKPKEMKRKENKEKDDSKTKESKKDKGNKNKEKSTLEDTDTFGKSVFDLLADRPMDDEDYEVDVSAWNSLGLSKETLSSLAKLKFSQPTAIQSASIPDILAGRDVIGKAATGSGKTLAFGIPILESYLSSLPDSKEKSPVALIVSPTRELAHQISAHLTALCSDSDFKAPFIATVTGGLSVQKQRRMLEKADIVVGTPGRLWEVISSGQGLMASFKKVRFLVVDEADRLLSEGHYKELSEILKIFEKDDPAEEDEQVTDTEIERQTLVFSATFHKGLQQKLAGKGPKGGGDLLNKQQSMVYLLKKIKFREEKPKFIDANPSSQMATGLKEGLVECAGTEKDLYLYSLLLFHPKKRALVFTNSISAVRRLTPFLQNLDLPALPLHSNMPQKARLRSVERFTERPGSILVATDVAARGLDIPGVELIIHYHLPRAADTYVHRSGRTARAEASGSSILICAPEEVAGVRRLVAKVHARAEDAPKTKKAAFFIRTLDIDRRIVSRLKPRATLSKKLADAVIAKEKKHNEDDLMRAAAEDLGVDYDSETFEQEAKGRRGRGSGRKRKEKEASQMTKAEMQGLRAELKSLLSHRVNTGVSARYLTSGGIDVEALMAGEGNTEFLGAVDGLGLEDE